MDTQKEAKKYLNKYFKQQYLKETDDEYKSLVRLLNKALLIKDFTEQSEQVVCDNCGCHPNVIYATSKGRFCENCKPTS